MVFTSYINKHSAAGCARNKRYIKSGQREFNLKICVPVGKNDGMKSQVYGHFGSAPFFAVYDTDKKELEVVENNNSHHEHGMCNPLAALTGRNIDAVVCGGMGAGAVSKLNAAGIKAYKVPQGALEDIVLDFGKNLPQEISIEVACKSHGCH